MYLYTNEVREWKVNERIIARMANFLDTDKEMFPVTKERIERITQRLFLLFAPINRKRCKRPCNYFYTRAKRL